jgi:hypothetical protein
MLDLCASVGCQSYGMNCLIQLAKLGRRWSAGDRRSCRALFRKLDDFNGGAVMKRTFAAALFALLTVTVPAHAATLTRYVDASSIFKAAPNQGTVTCFFVYDTTLHNRSPISIFLWQGLLSHRSASIRRMRR